MAALPQLSPLLLLLLLSIFISHASPTQNPNYTFSKNASQADLVSYYDYIIIGGGTAGCPLAATLSEKSHVLLLERGGLPYGNDNITDLAAFGRSLRDRSPDSPAQRFVSEDGVINSRARVLGGGSCLNAGFYTRAGLDYIAEVGWDERLVNESYKWVEPVVAFQPPMLQWQSALKSGLLEAGVTPDNGFTYDHLYGTKVGGTIFDKNGHRHTAADLLKYANPSRLTVLLYATVTRIIFRTRGKDLHRPVAHGVVFRDNAGKLHRAYLNKGSKFTNEIILSAGALGSPQLLMLNGVGPGEHLKSMNISVLVDNPMVGEGMMDNPMNAIYVPSPVPVEISLIQVVGITKLGTYIEGASGANFANPSSHQQDFTMFHPTADDAGAAAFRGGFILEKIIGPLSSGNLELLTRDADDNPKVTFNYFKHAIDLQRCVEGITIIEKVIESKSFSPFKYPYITIEALKNITASFPVNLLPRHGNDSTSREQFCRDTVMTIWHYHGGCQVGRVVDHDYKVIGVDALRVIDGSTFNFSPGTNPQATVMMLGRYMGVKIQNERLGRHAPVG